jgi:hypothetical protein
MFRPLFIARRERAANSGIANSGIALRKAITGHPIAAPFAPFTGCCIGLQQRLAAVSPRMKE